MLKSTTVNLDNSYLKNISKADMMGRVELSYDGYPISINTLVVYKGMTIRVTKLDNNYIYGVVVVDNRKFDKNINKDVRFIVSELENVFPSSKEFNELKEFARNQFNNNRELQKKISILLDKILVLQSDLLSFTEKARQQTTSYLDSLINRVDKVLKVK